MYLSETALLKFYLSSLASSVRKFFLRPVHCSSHLQTQSVALPSFYIVGLYTMAGIGGFEAWAVLSLCLQANAENIYRPDGSHLRPSRSTSSRI